MLGRRTAIVCVRRALGHKGQRLGVACMVAQQGLERTVRQARCGRFCTLRSALCGRGASALAGRRILHARRTGAIGLGGQPIAGREGTAEVGGIAKAPAKAQLGDGEMLQRAVAQVHAAALQPAFAQVGAEAGGRSLEQLLQIARGQPLGVGDGIDGQLGIAQPGFDGAADAAQMAKLHGAGRLGRLGLLLVGIAGARCQAGDQHVGERGLHRQQIVLCQCVDLLCQ